MKKTILLLIFSLGSFSMMNAQNSESDLNVGLIVQKTQHLYWENGFGADYTSDALLNRHLHLKAGYVTSRLGSCMMSNAVKQDNLVLGVDFRFRPKKPLQIFAGLNTGFFYANYEEPMFDVLPNTSLLLSAETGLIYKFRYPFFSVGLSAGYNIINGDGISKPGTLFPLYYKMSLFYKLGTKK
ncbi:MAG TPA: hypothetical protein P5084_03550 [Paludibacter sp.]|nr:hypothetical protein [Paludibacter sp.]